MNRSKGKEKDKNKRIVEKSKAMIVMMKNNLKLTFTLNRKRNSYYN